MAAPVVLIHGSGEEDRGGLRSYAKIFVRNGYAALIYDKRGVGKSGGDPDAWRRFSFDDLAGDGQPEPHPEGLGGHQRVEHPVPILVRNPVAVVA